MRSNPSDEFKGLLERVVEDGLLRDVAKAMRVFKNELEDAGFTSDQAMQIIVAHGLGITKT